MLPAFWLASLPPIAPCEPEPPFERAPAHAEAPRPPRSRATPPGTTLTLSWLVTQLIPSPELAVGDSGALFGLRWQVTPLLYSFGIDRRLSPWRALVTEPLVRTSGSVELFFAPEYLARDVPLAERFGFRAGIRAYFPLIEKGDYLSVSLGSAYVRHAGRDAASFQAGAYLLFGFLGFEQSFVPALAEARYVSTLNVRFF